VGKHAAEKELPLSKGVCSSRIVVVVALLALGSSGGGGGFIAGRDSLVRFLETTESDLIGRPCPPAVVAAARASLAVIRRDRRRVAMLSERADLFRKLAADSDLDLAASALSDGPLLSVVLGGSYPGLVASRRLFERGVKAELVRHPSIPGLEARLRVRITLAHREEAIAAAVQSIAAAIREA
jgi:8-amino-7-oxononanoate synthase